MSKKSAGQQKKSDSTKKRTGKNIVINTYIGKYEHIFNKRWTENEIKALADEMLDWFERVENKKPVNIWLKDFAISKRLSKQRLFEFMDKDSGNFNWYFKSVYEICQGMQESYLFKLGLSKQVSAGMPVFALKNVAGWSDIPSQEDPLTEKKTIKVEYI